MKRSLFIISLIFVSCSNEADSLREQLQQSENERKELMQKVSDLEDKVSNLKSEISEYASALEKRKQRIDDLETDNELNQFELERQQRQKELDRINQSLNSDDE